MIYEYPEAHICFSKDDLGLAFLFRWYYNAYTRLQKSLIHLVLLVIPKLLSLVIASDIERPKETSPLDEAEVLAGRFKSVSAKYYVLHDPEKLSDKYVSAWSNFGIDVSHTSMSNEKMLNN